MKIRTIRASVPVVGLFALFVLAVLAVFRGVIFDDGLLSYRDTLMFYFPVFEFEAMEWAAGRIPLWNPYSSCGEPFLATGTSSVLYPGKLLFHLPIPFVDRFHLYTIAHVVLAGALCGFVARSWGASLTGACIAAISYALSGSVVSQYCNVVFLCGAAWLPLALWFGDRMLRRRSVCDAVGLSFTLALMLLAGDPQMAYQAGGLVAILALMDFISERRSQAAQSERGERRDWQQSRTLLLVASAMIAGGVCAAQLLPTRELVSLSERGESGAPRSLYEIPGFLAKPKSERATRTDGSPASWYDTITGHPPRGSHDTDAFAMSIEPWRVAELLLPGVSGTFIGQERRWPMIIGWQRQAWAASLYMGIFPIVFAGLALRLCGSELRVKWLSIIGLIAAVASFGSYGPNAIINWFFGADAFEQTSSGGVGGLYWLMRLVLPGFAAFRFPAKLFVITSVAIALLAAVGFDRWVSDPKAHLRRFVATLLVVVATITVACWLLSPAIARHFDLSTEEGFRVLDSAGAASMIVRAGVHASMVLAILLVLDSIVFRSLSPTGECGEGDTQRTLRRIWAVRSVSVSVVAVDLAVSGCLLIAVVPREEWLREPAIVRVIRETDTRRSQAGEAPPRVFRPALWHKPLEELGLRFNSIEIEMWQRQTLLGKQNLPFRIAQIVDVGTSPINRFDRYFKRLHLRDANAYVQPRRSLDLWGAHQFLIPSYNNSSDISKTVMGLQTAWGEPGTDDEHPYLPFGEKLPIVAGSSVGGELVLPADAELRANDSAFPLCWIASAMKVYRSIQGGKTPSEYVYNSLVFPPEQSLNFRDVAIVEDAALADSAGEGVQVLNRKPVESRGSATVVEFLPNKVVIDADMAAQGLLVTAAQWYPGWVAHVETDGGEPKEAPILRTNLAMRGVILPRGSHRITFAYRPTSFYVGCSISVLTIIVAVSLIMRARMRRTSHPEEAG